MCAMLNKRNCSLCGYPVVLTEIAVGSNSLGQNANFSVAFICTGCGAEFSTDGENIRDMKNNAVCHVDTQSVDIDVLGEIHIGKR